MNTKEIIKLAKTKLGKNEKIKTIDFLNHLHESKDLSFSYKVYTDREPDSVMTKTYVYEILFICNTFKGIQREIDTRTSAFTMEGMIMEFILEDLERFTE